MMVVNNEPVSSEELKKLGAERKHSQFKLEAGSLWQESLVDLGGALESAASP
jgi:hypothetical protein